MDNKSHKEITSLKDFFQIIKANRVTFLLLFLLVMIAYGNLSRGEFLNMDDEKGILYNPNIGNIGKMFGTGFLYNMELTLIHAVFGLKPGAYHMFSVLSHYINVVLLFLFAYAVFDKQKALIASLLFAVHPLASEAVGWISAMHYLHIVFFTLITMIFHYLFRITAQKKYYVAEIVIFIIALAILRNAWVLTLPFSLLVFDQLIMNKKINFRSMLWILPYFIFAALHAYINLFGGFATRVTDLKQDYYYNPYTATPLLNRTPYIVFTIAKLLISPLALTVYHEGIYISIVSYIAMIAVTIAVVILTIKLYKKASYMAGFILLIFISTLPSFSPVAIAWFIAERYLYLSTMAFSLILAFLIPYLEKYTGIKKFTTYAVALLLAFYTIRTAVRTQDLLNTSNLWHATQKVSPYSFRVYNNLGDVYAREQKYDLAVTNFKKSIELDPTYADAVHNLGYVYLQMGDYDNAWKYLEQSYQMNPRLYGATYKMGVIAFYKKDYETAKTLWLKTLELNPGDANAINALKALEQAVAAEAK
ncbi:hypothetical protein A2473_02635 [candidate division WWE3 bacterium RIFOXYC2_FULL_42_13]|uniref:Uncharacterized protein n=2 Tax=Katanobacteria TaxID=422282 RepID=A0A3D0ZQZ1_UNCKA|nr:MAG: hypothetical protein A2245_04000 [candidate division WWE3 bacterium RIFOXYA2_FULL_43_12]OGC65583.1 MAG: hypothetical protein A2274_01815 [candidate division WWE3 bacterium RIFOXYA12_FULL_43_11]OGC71985.1 MAG: hypothetical protein A2337_01285 [candidate division WWE3 bacterium RIFOXYB2_FULL_43_9]OGC73389.1 MAG: hypothetical protein A2473_02635 [candidate division WWE3 bacterium RIFOXYC2_FULL_42_13]OGC75669.1 MAG: hypothetical protein A2547_03020 [candidate division WWE3 bacterium RIFOXYD